MFPALNSASTSAPGTFALMFALRLAQHATDALPAPMLPTCLATGSAGSGGMPAPGPRLIVAVHASVESGALAQALPR